jgi:hypothetical protein
MDFLITEEGGKEFQFPCEMILGRIPALHPLDEFETHVAEVKKAKSDCVEKNKRFFPVVNPNQNTKTKL